MSSHPNRAESALSANRLVFLGTGGARFMLARQLLATAGMWVELEGQRLSIDPGPGALVHAVCRGFDPTTLDGVLLTHQHLDHSGDINAVIEAMTLGGSRRRGTVFCPDDALGPNGVVHGYLRDYPDQLVTLAPEHVYRLGALEFTTTVRLAHGVETYGVRVQTRDGTIGLLTDTAVFEGLAEQYMECAVLIVHVVLLEARDNIPHLSVREAEEILGIVRPEIAILTHFGMTVWRAKPWKIAERMAQALGLPVIAAWDGMVFDVAARQPLRKRKRPPA